MPQTQSTPQPYSSRFVIRLILALFLTLAPFFANAGATPAFWQVNSRTATVYLLGSMHFGLESFYPLPEPVETAFAESELLVVEVDITSITPQEATSVLLRQARQPQGQTLAQEISEGTYTDLRAKAQAGGIPMVPLENFRPWFVALQLVEAEIRKTPYKQQYGVDMYFLKRKQGKQVLELESLESQLGIFSSLTADQQEVFLQQTLKDLTASKDYLDVLADTWQRGDVPAMDKLLLEPFLNDASAKPLYEKLFIERNREMTSAVRALLEGEQTVFFIVGAAHMLGEDGIIAALNQAGFTPQRVTPVVGAD